MNNVSKLFIQEFADLATSVDPAVVEKKIGQVNNEVSAVWTMLMGYEMQLVDQLEVNICSSKFENEFDTN